MQLSINRTACGLGHAPLFSMTGLGYSACDGLLYATDGKQVIWGTISVSSSACSFTHGGCCNNTLGEPYTGIAVLPWAQSLVNKPCATKSCNACPPVISTSGDAVLGNAQFAVNMTGAPSNATNAVLAIGLGNCSTPGASLGFCQPATIAFTAPGPFLFFWLGLSPISGTCDRSLSLPLSISVAPAACGLRLSMQWVTTCKGAPTGSAVSSCLNVPISGI